MKLYQKSIFLTIPAMLLLTGCMEVSSPFDPGFKQNGSGQKTGLASARFQDMNPDSPTAVESAIELSKKYAALSEEVTNLKLEKQNLESDKSLLKQQAESLQEEVKQAKKELAEANDLLIEMRIELNNWKTDVLGFRDEMRQADKIQLETLVKILKALGGEVKDDITLEQ
jgi:chromosome segregation ATPase